LHLIIRHAKISSIVPNNHPIILIRGGGDLASGVALRLWHVGLKILMTEHPKPLAVRRLVSFAEAVYRGKFSVEGVTAHLVHDIGEIEVVQRNSQIPILVDPDCNRILSSTQYSLVALVDARMIKKSPSLSIDAAPLVVGLGPGFVAGENAHAVVETNRGHFLGRVLWKGAPEADTGIPGTIGQHRDDRVLRAPCDGQFKTKIKIGEQVTQGQLIAVIGDQKITAPFNGNLRGLLHDGIYIKQGMKVGDVDPRNDPRFASLVSEKSLAIGGGVLEALLTFPNIRKHLWN
jgi:xanthine dehydrogenase accessory factor